MQSSTICPRSGVCSIIKFNRGPSWHITRLVLATLALCGGSLVALGVCQFHLPYWASYIGYPLLAIASVLFMRSFVEKKHFIHEENVIGNDDLTLKKFCAIMPKYSPHKSNYTHLVFAAFNKDQAHNLFDSDGVVGYDYEKVNQWPDHSILIIICARDSGASKDLFGEPGWIKHILSETDARTSSIYKKSDWIGLDHHEVAQLNGGRLPRRLRNKLFGNMGGALSYLM